MKKLHRAKTVKASAPEKSEASRSMTAEQIKLIATAMNTEVCDAIQGHCKLEVDEVRLRDALLKELTSNSYWDSPDTRPEPEPLMWLIETNEGGLFHVVAQNLGEAFTKGNDRLRSEGGDEAITQVSLVED